VLPKLGEKPFPLFSADTAGLPEGEPVLDAKFSLDGSLCGFVCASEVYVCTVGTGKVTQVTSGAREAGLSHGVADFVAQVVKPLWLVA
jgi:hypothetical protein